MIFLHVTVLELWFSEIAAETEVIHQKNVETGKLNESIAAENDAIQKSNDLGRYQVKNLKQQINDAKLNMIKQAKQLAIAETKCYNVDKTLNLTKDENEVAVQECDETKKLFLSSNQVLLIQKSSISQTQSNVMESTARYRKLKDQRNDFYARINDDMARFNALDGRLCGIIETTNTKVVNLFSGQTYNN